MRPTYIVIHHSLTEDGKTVSWQAIRKFHMEQKGWRDIAYHYGIELVNARHEIFKGRMDDEDGAHAIGFNDKSLGICMIGNFDVNPPAEEQASLLLRLVRGLQRVFSIPKERVIGHCETYDFLERPREKNCPGRYFDLADFRSRLE